MSRQKNEGVVAITAVVPTLNRPDLLREALRSLQRQTLPPDEIIVIDDGSNPPVDKAALHAEFGPQVRVLRNEKSRGLAYGRNWGVEEAKGKYVVHLDDDDLLAPETLDEARRLLESDPALEIVFLGVEGFGPHAEHFNRVQPEAIRKVCARVPGCTAESSVFRFDDGLMEAMLKAVPAAFQHTMMPRETWQEVSALRWRAYQVGTSAQDAEAAKALITGQLRDSEWAIYASAVCKRTALINKPLYLFRCEGQSLSSRPENIERHLVQNIKIRTQLFHASSLPQLTPWKAQIRQSLALTNFDAAYYFWQERNPRRAIAHAIRSFSLSPSWKPFRLALKMWLPHQRA